MGAIKSSLQADAMLADQREVLDYWCSLKLGAALPARSAFRPAAIARRLPTISMIDVASCGARFRFRLAGTGLREAFGEDLTGRPLEAVCSGTHYDHWQGIYADIAATAAPASGFLPLTPKDRPGVIQAWLRLPLADAEGRVTTILGYDRFLPLLRRPPRGAAANLPSWDDAIAAISRTVFTENRLSA